MPQYNIVNRIIRKTHQLCWMAEVALHHGDGSPETGKLVLFDPSIDSLNLGDEIIHHYCDLALAELLEKKETFYVPTHTLPSDAQLSEIKKSEVKIVCGTNLIAPHYEEFSNWKMPGNLSGYKDVITLGVGWGYYCDEISKTSRFVYHNVLSSTGLHSVRDSYTEGKFRAMGIENVLNTGCPSIWGLTQQHCAGIPQKKAKSVVTTLTDYAQDAVDDRRMLSILLQNYENVFVWLQGTGDHQYLEQLIELDRIHVIEPNLDAYTAVLQAGEIDYVGTRLHAGIYALNLGVRSIILAVDNRATEMGRDFALPVILRSQTVERLAEMIQSAWPTKVIIPEENIQKWKAQFRGRF